jgi:hypothetical protein
VVVRTGQQLIEWTLPADAFRRSVEWTEFRAGESPDAIAELYELPRPTVDEAPRYELPSHHKSC